MVVEGGRECLTGERLYMVGQQLVYGVSMSNPQQVGTLRRCEVPEHVTVPAWGPLGLS